MTEIIKIQHHVHPKVLVVGGGGCAAMAYIGVLKRMQESNLLNGLETFVGTSAGAIICLFLVLGFSIEDILDVTHECPVDSIFDDDWGVLRDLFSVVNSFGYYKGEEISRYVEVLLERKGLSKESTFADLYDHLGKRLVVVSSDILTEKPYIFSYSHTKNTKISLAIKASTAIPILFPPVKIDENHILVDGGLVDNFPLQFVPKDYEDDEEVIGLFLQSSSTNTTFQDICSGLRPYLLSTLNTIMVQTSRLLLNENKGKKTIIAVDRQGLGMLPSNGKSSEKYENAIKKNYQKYKFEILRSS